LVDFEGKQKLVIVSNGNANDKKTQELMIDMFSNEICKKIKDKEFKDWYLPNFTTTTDTDKTVGSIILMAATKEYFSYMESFMCGFPEITLLGYPDDWILIRNKINKLLEFDVQGLIHKWHSVLVPVIEQFVPAAKGTPDLPFWNKVFCYHNPRGSGTPTITGWFKVFCAFNDQGWQYDKTFNTSDITTGIVQADIFINNQGVEYETVVYAGSTGFYVIDNDTLQPSLSWCLFKKNPNELESLEILKKLANQNTDEGIRARQKLKIYLSSSLEYLMGIGSCEKEDFRI
jgi:hypothetical protein